MQFSSWATYIGNQPSWLVVVRQAKTSVGQMCRQKPHALHMSSPSTTSHWPLRPVGALFSGLNSAMRSPPLSKPGDAGALTHCRPVYLRDGRYTYPELTTTAAANV